MFTVAVLDIFSPFYRWPKKNLRTEPFFSSLDWAEKKRSVDIVRGGQLGTIMLYFHVPI